MNRCAFVIAAIAVGCRAMAAGGRGAPLLTDDFSVKETFPERWRVTEAARFGYGAGALTVKGTGSVAEATLVTALPENLWVEGEVSYDGEVPKGHWAGFQIDGHLFLTMDGKTWLHPTGDAATSEQSGKVCESADYKTGKPMRISVMREEKGGSYKYAFFLDGRPGISSPRHRRRRSRSPSASTTAT